MFVFSSWIWLALPLLLIIRVVRGRSGGGFVDIRLLALENSRANTITFIN